ncbi:class II aldolase/adducin family protein [Burkholderia pseudomultivorans]|uniref:Aldolase n=1 Tax=Burkholderia pseudomultivorans TaxID=1207504 RepID=A0A6P2RJ75_9BURK|nr:class II aldolase/adducin family protein [Burkholderia pseudomultivorans]MDR8729509.1 L-ribulose-5-phosphate 4-epimerase SgbE [Burkholderia pseudomultivorans]MDR8737325.1 L-ribulose-5-phosphate 4-epimerase SgbE [Burkholderia pseudomultivorans]MDR8743433.1 L-ribulose-5-phosphate 4-epimerase SgbE [Burkholderia pseudomultivorans]MDR8757102.1 L-ribulose-5-phosphate 4-epimerase SgbE [Burkholderia pseudomultivorans]MDR8780052.1 L-ribulose-5-phosphate 4-epimerase SgbE [Burkholderia pseudomultivora
MSVTSTIDSGELVAFVERATREFAQAVCVLKDTRTLSATNTFQAFQRVPGTDLVVALSAPSPWAASQEIQPVVVTFDGDVLHGDARAGGNGPRYADVFREAPEVDVVIHVHGPYLGAWASAHRALPIRYAPAARHTRAREIPIYIDRRPGEPRFIVDTIRRDPQVPAILEANGGATFWGKSIVDVSKYILILEEAAYFQALAEPLGGSREFGPGALEQQWKMTGLA